MDKYNVYMCFGENGEYKKLWNDKKQELSFDELKGFLMRDICSIMYVNLGDYDPSKNDWMEHMIGWSQDIQNIGKSDTMDTYYGILDYCNYRGFQIEVIDENNNKYFLKQNMKKGRGL